MLYCMESDDSIMHLTALSYSGDWLPPSSALNSFPTTSSALPASLPSNTVVTLPHFDNYWYVGPRDGSTASLLDSLSNPSNWEGSNTETYQPSGGMETKFMDGTSEATTTRAGLISLLGMSLIVIVVSVYVV